MTTVAIALALWLLVNILAVLVWVRIHRATPPVPFFRCERCGAPTGWSWFGRPLCPVPCRKRELEAGDA